jgi:acyl-CoA thioesterase-1
MFSNKFKQPLFDLTIYMSQFIPKIMPLGDSLTDGYYVPGGYRQFLWQKLHQQGISFEFVGSETDLGDPVITEFTQNCHEGHSGWKIHEIDFMLLSWLPTTEPDLILLLIGTNDILGNYAPDQAPQRLERLLNNLWEFLPATKVILGSLPPVGHPDFNAAVLDYNEAIQRLVKRCQKQHRGIYFADLYPVITEGDLLDGVHIDVNGYKKMADAWLQVLEPLLLEMDYTGS